MKDTEALDINHTDFEWLRAYLQREESRANENTENDVVDETSEDVALQAGAKRQKFSFPLMPLAPTEPYLAQRTLSGNSARTLSGSLSNASADELLNPDDPLGPDGRRRKVGWTSTEDLAILAIFRRLGTQWSVIAAQLPGRTPDAVRNRWHRLQKTHSLGDTEEGRAALDALLLACGIAKDWSPPTDPAQPPTANACIKGSDHGRAMWTAHEDTMIEEGVRRFGCKWREIAKSLPGRSDSSVRNRWMRLQRDKAAARGVDELVGVQPAPAEEGQFVVPACPVAAPAATAPTLPPVPEVSKSASAEAWAQPLAAAATPPSAVAAAEPVTGRPAALPTLKRLHSSRGDAMGKQSPLGFGSPMLGFDLMSFVDAVSNAVEEERATPALGKVSAEALTFEETLLPVTRSMSERISFTSMPESDKAEPDKPFRGLSETDPFDEAPLGVPGGLGLLSALLTGFAALTVCASIKAASSTRLR